MAQSVAASATAATAGALPALREDLRLLPGPANRWGQPSWTIHDPAAHRFIRIGWLEFEILARWGLGDPTAIAAAITRDTTLAASPAQVMEVAAFAQKAQLLMPQGMEWGQMMAAQAGHKLSAFRWLLKNYLFVRVRLLNPDRALAALQPMMAWAFHPLFPLGLLLGGLLGLYLVGRQWAQFTHTLPWVFTVEGALCTGVALTLAKIAHELGHGFAARHFGCRVPAMGVALLVMWPVLWTDTTDAWRLTDRRQRLIIDAAGMMAELLVAVVASLLWAALPDGAVRSAVFLLAGTTWIMTLAVNLNPLMRFDGYFLLSDLLDEPNLQDRTFAMGRWWLREMLFGLGEVPPETLSPDRRRVFVAYALATWVYRFFLFLGIALLVYHMAFKALGLVLMMVEIWWFIARPVMNEVREWHKRGSHMRGNRRAWITLALASLVVVSAVIPWQGRVAAPALLRAERQMVLYTAQPGFLDRVSVSGQQVRAGEALFTLSSPELELQQIKATAESDGLRTRLTGISFDPQAQAQSLVAREAFGRADAQGRDVAARQDALVVRAPFDGVVEDVPRGLYPGLAMGKHEALGILRSLSGTMVEAFVPEADLARLHAGATARFYPESGERPVELTVLALDRASTREVDQSELASVHGGAIAVRQDANRKLVPEQSIYRVTLIPAESVSAPDRTQRGSVQIASAPQSLVAMAWRRSVALVIRESGL